MGDTEEKQNFCETIAKKFFGRNAEQSRAGARTSLEIDRGLGEEEVRRDRLPSSQRLYRSTSSSQQEEILKVLYTRSEVFFQGEIKIAPRSVAPVWRAKQVRFQSDSVDVVSVGKQISGSRDEKEVASRESESSLDFRFSVRARTRRDQHCATILRQGASEKFGGRCGVGVDDDVQI